MSVDGTVMLVGACGMLGRDCKDVFEKLGISLALCGFNRATCDGKEVLEIDVTNKQFVFDVVTKIRPSWIINCAAYTAVDKAEQEPDVAMLVNAVGARNCAEAALAVNASLVHISSDYVFGNNIGNDLSSLLSKDERRAFSENAPINPCGAYGKSKAKGDLEVLSVLPNSSLIIRTSWLHGLHGHNFVDTMLKLGANGRDISVVDDQIGSPTWSLWLASIIAKLMNKKCHGVFHACSRGGISWYDFAKEIFECASLKVNLSRQSTAQANRPAPRPTYSVLDVSKLEAELGEPCISWKQCVEEHVRARVEQVKECCCE